MIIDTHCHMSKNDYDNLDEVIKNMDGIIITSGCDNETNKEVVELVNKYNNVYGTIGIHPEAVDNYNEENLLFIENNLNNKKIVGIGEIGLDYYYTSDNKDKQIELFKKQLDIAEKHNKPVVVHSRDAINDTYEILKSYNLKGDIHCFSSSLEMALKFIDLGYMIGIGGVVTFKNAKKLVDIVDNIPLDKILLETDSPYLSPEPLRGKKNEPKNVKFVAMKVAEIKNKTYDEVISITTKNASELFDLKINM